MLLMIVSVRVSSKGRIVHSAKNQCRKLETNIPRKGIARPKSLFRAGSTVLASALLNLLENSLGRSKPATRLMQAQ
jgi:hypothetical protein